MSANTETVGNQIAISHGKHPNKATGRNCYGGAARVTEVHPRTFAATCECGYRFAGMHTDGYRAV
jgi:hypothetical protein